MKSLVLLFPLLVALLSGTPEASPVPGDGCAELESYFQNVATLLETSSGYAAIDETTSLFSLPDGDKAQLTTSLDDLLISLETIEPPIPAVAFHDAFIDQVTWYRDLVSAPDHDTWQRIVNRDKQLLPAMSRAILVGQTACGYETWIRAHQLAFGEH